MSPTTMHKGSGRKGPESGILEVGQLIFDTTRCTCLPELEKYQQHVRKTCSKELYPPIKAKNFLHV
jgi:hypothetical protein